MSPKPKDAFYILDGHAILHRAWHALPPLATKDGKLVNAVYGFLLILLKLLREEKPTHLAATFDLAAPTFRHEAYEAYKAQREKAPDELYAQIPIIHEVLAAFGIPIFEKTGYEADDVIGTIATKTAASGVPTVIVTGDLDALQLVGPKISVYTFAHGLKDAQVYDEAAVKARYGLRPDQLIDYKALRGDPSDNIKGVKGIGEKTASELMQTFGSLDALYDALKKRSAKTQKLREKLVETLVAGEQDARQSKDLVTIRRNVPIDFSLADAAVREPDLATITKLFQELGFRSLLDKLPSAEGDQSEARNQKSEIRSKKISRIDYQLVTSKNDAITVVTKLRKAGVFAFRAFPRSEDFMARDFLGIAVSWGMGQAAFVSAAQALELAPVFADPHVQKIGHDVKRDLHLFQHAPSLEGRGAGRVENRATPTPPLPPQGGGSMASFDDLMIASYLLAPGTRAHELTDLVFEHFGRKLPEPSAQGALLPPRLEDTYRAMCEEADFVLQLRDRLVPQLAERSQTKLYEEIELPLVPVLAAMERHGVKIDSEYLSDMAKHMHRRLKDLSKKIYEHAGEEFNINSPQQLKKILFEKLAIVTKVKKTATGALSTAAGELEKMRGAHPIIDLIFEHRELSKLVSTYVDTLPTLVRKDTGRVHASFNQTVAATGRLSASNPNLQNIPVRSELGREIRKAFVAEKGCVLVSADYSQIELRLIAVIASVKRMRAAFRDGADIHAATAAEVWNVPLEKVTKEQRYAAKTINFGLLYGMGPNSLAAGTGMSFGEAREFIERYFDVYSEIQAYMDATKTLAATQGYVETLFGRRRYLPEITSGVGQVRAAAERMAINAPVQGSAADLLKKAMIAIHGWITTSFGLGPDAPVKMIMQVHDELVFEVKKDLVNAVATRVRDFMEHAHEFPVPIVVEAEAGLSWGDLKNIS